ncbi:MAG: zinc-ribbon domain-containing protein, partial [Oceanidesulfovibrio sp.]
MIVQCPSCSTKYNLPDDKVKEGAKLRCSVCKNVFPLSGPADMEAPAEPAAPEPEPEAPDLESELPGAATEEEVFSSTYNEEEDIDFGDFGDLGLEGLDDLDEETTADAAASGDEVDFGDLGLDEETPEFGPAEMDTEEGEDEDSFEDIFGKKEVPEDLGVDIDEQEAEEEEAVAQARVSRGEDLFDIDAQEKKRATEVEKKKTKKKGNPVVSAVFFALLLLGAGVVVAYLYFPDVLRSIPIVGGFVESPAEPDQPGEPDQPAQPEQAAPEEQGAVANIEDLALKDIQQNYVENEKVGELFVVQGSVVNNFQSPKE